RLNNIKAILSAYQKQNSSAEEISPSLIKSILGCSIPQANNYFSVLKAPKIVLEAIEQNQLKNLEKAAFVARTTISVVQHQLLQACIAGSSLKQLKELADKTKQIEKQQKKQSLATQLAAGRGRKSDRIELGVVREPIVIKTLIN